MQQPLCRYCLALFVCKMRAINSVQQKKALEDAQVPEKQKDKMFMF